VSTLLAEMPASTSHVNRSRHWQAFVSALSIEFVVLFLAIGWLTAPPLKAVQAVVPLSVDWLDSEKPPEPEKPGQVLPSPPAALPQLQSVRAVPKPVPPVQMATQTSAAVAPSEAAPVAAVPSPPSQTTATAAPPQAAVAATPPPTIDPAPAYNAKLAAAVQAAFELPAAASALNFKGRTRIEFSLKEGVATAIRVVTTSGLGAVDRAAMKAVQSAVYPPPPAALQTRESPYQIWVACY
jgi:periplasmic protein TonB